MRINTRHESRPARVVHPRADPTFHVKDGKSYVQYRDAVTREPLWVYEERDGKLVRVGPFLRDVTQQAGPEDPSLRLKPPKLKEYNEALISECESRRSSLIAGKGAAERETLRLIGLGRLSEYEGLWALAASEMAKCDLHTDFVAMKAADQAHVAAWAPIWDGLVVLTRWCIADALTKADPVESAVAMTDSLPPP